MIHVLVKAVWICWWQQIDYVIGFTVPYGVLAWITAKLTRSKTGISFIGADLYKGIREACYRKIVISMLPHCDHITVTGKEMREILVDCGVPKNRIHVLPHGIERPYSRPKERSQEYDMVFVGELIPRKRVDVLLDAFKLVKETFEDARFCIVGDGPLRSALEAQAMRAGISAAVDFEGFQDDVWPYLEKSKVFVLASEGEGLPFAMIEAMVCGLVPVVTDVGTIRDVVTNGENGFLVKMGEPHTLAKSVERLLTDGDLYREMSQKAMDIGKDFSYQKTVEVWDDIFSQGHEGNSV
jgi:glycosyltransferase involved in cell wall biosynthesis